MPFYPVKRASQRVNYCCSNKTDIIGGSARKFLGQRFHKEIDLSEHFKACLHMTWHVSAKSTTLNYICCLVNTLCMMMMTSEKRNNTNGSSFIFVNMLFSLSLLANSDPLTSISMVYIHQMLPIICIFLRTLTRTHKTQYGFSN